MALVLQQWRFFNPHELVFLGIETPVWYKRPLFCTRILTEHQVRVAVAAGEGFGWLEDGFFVIRENEVFQNYPELNFFQNWVYYVSHPPSWIIVPEGLMAARKVPFVYVRPDYLNYNQVRPPFPDPDDGNLDLDPITGVLEAAGVLGNLERNEGDDQQLQDLVDQILEEPEVPGIIVDDEMDEEDMVVVDFVNGNNVIGHGVLDGFVGHGFVEVYAVDLLWVITQAMVLANAEALVEGNVPPGMAIEVALAEELQGEGGEGEEEIEVQLVDSTVHLTDSSEDENEAGGN